jgi:hypothetical protein
LDSEDNASVRATFK